jgi:hypothetical protein
MVKKKICCKRIEWIILNIKVMNKSFSLKKIGYGDSLKIATYNRD